jgi:hypothetical protein
LARSLVLAWHGIILAVLLSWAWLLAPAVPDGELMSRWAHEAPGRDVFRGRVESVRLNGLSMPRNGPPPDSAALRRRLAQGVFSLDAEVTSGQPAGDRLWIYMFRVPSGGVLTLNQRDLAAGVAIPVRGLKLKLHHPVVTLPEGFPPGRGIPVQLHAEEFSRRVRISSSYGGSARVLELGVSPAFGWALFSPFEVAAGLAVRWVTAAVLAMLLLPLGYWAGWLRAGWRGLALLSAGPMLALGVLPVVTGYPPVHWSEWLAAVAGCALGWLLERVVASSREPVGDAARSHGPPRPGE